MRNEEGEEVGDVTLAVDMLTRFFAYVFTKRNINKPHQVAYLLYLFCWAVRPDLLGKNLTEIGVLFGKNRRRVSEKVLKLLDELGLHGRGQKSESARRIYSEIKTARLELEKREKRTLRKLTYDKNYWNANKAKYNAQRREKYRGKS